MNDTYLRFIKDMNDVSEARTYSISSIYETEIDEYYSLYNEKVGVSDSIVTSIKRFFINIIQEIDRWISSIVDTVDRKKTEAGYRKNLLSIEKKLKDNIDSGKNSDVKITDHEYILKEYKKRYKELSKYAKKFAHMDYKSTAEIDDDLEKFNKILYAYEDEMTAIENKTITVDAKTALSMVQKELNGNSSYLETISELKSDIKEMEKESLLLEKRMDALGASVIPKHLNFIRRMTVNISRFSRKCLGKFIGKFVFTFANII